MTIAINRFTRSQPFLNSRATLFVVCVTVALSYLVPTLVTVLIANHKTVWPLWPGCAILVTGLLLVRISVWPLLIAASFAAFALADLQAGVSLSSIAWFIPGNTVEVLISAIGLRYCFDGVPRLNSVIALAKYSFFAIVLAPFAGAFVSSHGIARDYWNGWKIVVLSEVLAFITVTPALLSWVSEGRALMRKSRALHLEGLILVAGLILASSVVFTLPQNSTSPTLFYTLVPFLLWSALRFGWLGVSTSLIVVTSLSIWGAVYGRGPFSNFVPLTNPIPLQMFLIFAAIPFMVLAALAEEHEEAAQVVRESEMRFRLVADTAPVMIWMSGPDKKPTYFNQLWLDFTGFSENDLENRLAEIVHPEDNPRCHEVYCRGFDQRQPFRKECRLRRHDGQYRWMLDIGVPRFHKDGSFAGYIGSCVDVTEHKQAEETLAAMSRRLMEAQEQERARIARELHDDINQRLSLLSVDLEVSRQNPPDSGPDMSILLTELQERIGEISTDVQSISHRLHSSQLEYLGIVAAARSFCRECSASQNVEIDFKHDDIPPSVSSEISLCLFRVLQEALHNAIKYSKVRHFEVRLSYAENQLGLTASDHGVGFDPESASSTGGLGLTSMKERVRLVNGTISIESRPLQGTTINVRVPLKAEHDWEMTG